MTALETYVGASVGALTLIDLFARERGTRGQMPAPIPPLRFTLVARQEQAGSVALAPPIELIARSGTSGAYLFADEARIGDLPLTRIAAGTYLLRIESDHYETLETNIEWRPTPAPLPPLLLRPASAYPFPDATVPTARLLLLRGTVVRDVTGEPIAGALVEITDPSNLGPLAVSPSDGRGAWVLAVPLPLAMPAPNFVALRITLPGGGGVIDVANVTIAPAAENTLSQTTLRGAVLSTRGEPISGAAITVDVAPGESVRSASDGAWSFYFGLNQPGGAAQITALAPNGDSQSQDVQIRSRATVVVPTFRFAMN